MRTIRFVREPGFTYDLFFSFVLYFNQEHCMRHFINPSKAKQDRDYYQGLLTSLGNIPVELELFFRMRKDGLCFMTQAYFDPYSDGFTTTYDLTIVQEALTDVPHLTGQALDFYFPGKWEARDALPPVSQISAWIRESTYTGSLRASLYAFFFEPAVVAGMLSQELEAKASIVSRLYVENAALFAEQRQKFDLEALQKRIRKIGNLEFNLDFPNVYVAFCLFSKNMIYSEYCEKHVILCLGYDYRDMTDYMYSQDQQAALGAAGNAPEENTVTLEPVEEQEENSILSLFEQEEETTVSDVVQKLGFTKANALYHLTLMLKNNILRCSNRGPTNFYSLNRPRLPVKSEHLPDETSGGETGGWQICVFNSF